MRNSVKNRTNNVKIKSEKLSKTHVIPTHNIKYNQDTIPFLKELLDKKNNYTTEQILYSVGKKLLGYDLEEYIKYNSDLDINIPDNTIKEHDLLGTIYQYLTPKNIRLDKGSFYTSENMIESIIKNEMITESDTIFDPSCGSGNLLFTSKVKNPEQIYGVDLDEIAIMCCKFNYYLKFGKTAPAPKIYCMDYFDYIEKFKRKYDYVINNPPFGATLDVSKMSRFTVDTEDSLTFFVEHCSKLSNKKSIFILPESVTNVKKHTKLRKWLLDNVNLSKINSFGSNFSGTIFPIISMIVDNTSKSNTLIYDNKLVNKQLYYTLPFYYFRPISEEDQKFIIKIFNKKTQSLKDSVFGLGIVTGNNKKYVFNEEDPKYIKTLTGKNITKYNIVGKPKYINKDLNLYQQVANENLYKTKGKFIYKVVSNDLNFVLDNEGVYTLNSANFFIPKNLTITNKCLLALLNSEIYDKLNKLLFGENKVSKLNLQNLPIPSLNETTKLKLEKAIDDKKYEIVNEILHDYFELDKDIDLSKFTLKFVSNTEMTLDFFE